MNGGEGFRSGRPSIIVIADWAFKAALYSIQRSGHKRGWSLIRDSSALENEGKVFREGVLKESGL